MQCVYKHFWWTHASVKSYSSRGLQENFFLQSFNLNWFFEFIVHYSQSALLFSFSILLLISKTLVSQFATSVEDVSGKFKTEIYRVIVDDFLWYDTTVLTLLPNANEQSVFFGKSVFDLSLKQIFPGFFQIPSRFWWYSLWSGI